MVAKKPAKKAPAKKPAGKKPMPADDKKKFPFPYKKKGK
mgnify:CR=1 FL=1